MCCAASSSTTATCERLSSCLPAKRCLVPPSQSKQTPVRKARKAKKSVRFAPIAKVALVDVTQEELKQTWNQPQDYLEIHVGMKRSLQAVHKNAAEGNPADMEVAEDCLRGLESGMSPGIMQLRQEWIRTTLFTVLKEQAMQRRLGLSDPESLGARARQASTAAQKCAAAIAIIDSVEADFEF